MSDRVISFDLDGVLIKTDGLHDQAFCTALEDLGLTNALMKYHELAADGQAESLSTRQKLMLVGADIYYAQIKAAKDAAFFKLLDRVEVNPDAPEQFRALVADGGVLAVVTNCTASMACTLLDLTKIPRETFLLVAPGAPGVPADTPTKPHPALYIRAQQLLGATIDLALEDSDNGVTAARAAGVKTVVKTNFETVKEHLKCAL